MKKFLLTILILLTATGTIFAEDIAVDDLLGDTDDVDTQEVEQLEEERLEEIENELNISIPEYTDNPSHIVTFVDPSEEKVGVELDIDESGFKDIISPYSLPSLGIGEHHLKFRFVDSLGATKLLEYDTVIIPRPPIIKAPTFENDYLTISGTGFANSEVIVTLSVNATNFIEIADIDSDGDWSTSIALETTVDGIYTVFAYTRKDGYASNPSEPAVLAFGDGGLTTASDFQDQNETISFSFKSITLDNLLTTLTQNPDLIISLVGFLLLGSLISSILITLIRKNDENGVNQEFSKKLNNSDNNTPEKTLLEVFSEKSPKPQKPEKKQKEKRKPKLKKKKVKKEKIFTKKDFLKNFKKFDPDSDTGKKKREPSKKDKKKILVSLTSKVEE
ncbi:TPA: hypothetical protein DEP90_02630 [Patescibacteria group bacterium]|nr:hypothetical protein [Patescibacteria group bacterium]